MNIITRYTLRAVIAIYVISLALFVFALQLVEIVTNLVQYIQLAVPLSTVLQLQLLFLPIGVHFALPIAMLFSVSFSMGHFHSTRELLAVFSIGVSMIRFCVPIFVFAGVVSLFSFILEDAFVVGARAKYNSLRESILLINPTADNEFIAVFGGDGNDIYYAQAYDRSGQTLIQPTFVERDARGYLTRRISANSARWDGEYWILENTHSYTWDEAGVEVAHIAHGRTRLPNLEVTPDSFESAELKIGEMNLRQAQNYIVSRRRSGLPFREELTVYHKRFAFAGTAFVVALISCGIGAVLRRNTLLLSMLLSLSATVLYYVLGLIIDLLAFNGYIAPILAAWLPVLIFLAAGGFAFRNLTRF